MTVRSKLLSLEAVVAHLREKYGPPPALVATPEAAEEARRLLQEGMELGARSDYHGAIGKFDAAMLRVGETANLLAARSMSFLALGERSWYLFDMREALERHEAGEPLMLTPADREENARRIELVAQELGVIGFAELRSRRQADTFYSRGFRAWKEDHKREAIAWIAESLAVTPLALACWYGGIFLAQQQDAEAALFLLDLLPSQSEEALAQLFAGVSPETVARARAAVADLALLTR
ncbi:MAG: hypothetical protein H6Q89_1964 [Myxococcaceae bacterium]|nr:hypothetical protein [Myxococcaceae bacterium]